MSKRLVITLPDSVAKDLAKESKARQVSMSFILRDAYVEHRIHASLGRMIKRRRSALELQHGTLEACGIKILPNQVPEGR